MPSLRVMVSSTAYDLAVLRSSLRSFIERQGFEPVLSEYSDVLYDFRDDTHRSCLDEVERCDMLVLVVGSRFGSELADEDVAKLSGTMDLSLLRRTGGGPRLSITQAEALTAVERCIPVFAFVDRGVEQDYQTYRRNRGQPFASQIVFASVSKPGTAEYIFSFIELMKTRQRNNAFIVFDRIDDIYSHLQKQWSALFQKLLDEARGRRADAVRIDRLAEQFEELKAALLSSIGADRRTIARAAISYRRLIVFLKAIPNSGTPLREAVAAGGADWDDLLRSTAGITAIEDETDGRAACRLLREGAEEYVCELDRSTMSRLAVEWRDFVSMDRETRELVFEELVTTIQPSELRIVTERRFRPRESPGISAESGDLFADLFPEEDLDRSRDAPPRPRPDGDR